MPQLWTRGTSRNHSEAELMSRVGSLTGLSEDYRQLGVSPDDSVHSWAAQGRVPFMADLMPHAARRL